MDYELFFTPIIHGRELVKPDLHIQVVPYEHNLQSTVRSTEQNVLVRLGIM